MSIRLFNRQEVFDSAAGPDGTRSRPADSGTSPLANPALRVHSTFGHEFVMAARFNDSPVSHHVNGVSKHCGCKPVGDDDRGPSGNKLAKPTQPFGFGPRVHSASGLV